jgi:hypothetical protein
MLYLFFLKKKKSKKERNKKKDLSFLFIFIFTFERVFTYIYKFFCTHTKKLILLESNEFTWKIKIGRNEIPNLRKRKIHVTMNFFLLLLYDECNYVLGAHNSGLQ